LELRFQQPRDKLSEQRLLVGERLWTRLRGDETQRSADPVVDGDRTAVVTVESVPLERGVVVPPWFGASYSRTGLSPSIVRRQYVFWRSNWSPTGNRPSTESVLAIAFQ